MHITLSSRMASKVTQALFVILNSENHESRFVGGCVRDSLLSLSIHDIDITTTRTPEEILQILQPHSAFTCIPTGIEHGTITVISEKEKYEITSLREDISCDGRHASVGFTRDFKKDALRRDFTINALSCDISGKIFDYTKGVEDLKNNIICFVGNPLLRVQEDHLRILRFFRFYARFGGNNIHHASLSACLDNASLLHAIAGERITQEIIALLHTADPSSALKIMQDSPIFPVLFSQNCTLTFYHQLEERKIFSHVASDLLPYIRLAALIKGGDNPREILEFVKKRWKISNKIYNFLSFIINPPYGISFPYQDIRRVERLLYRMTLPYFTGLLWLHTEDFLDTPSWLKHYHQMMKHASTWQRPVFPLNGKDIMQYSSIPEGKRIKMILDAGHTWWEDQGYISNKEEILNYLVDNSYIAGDLHI